MLRLHDPTTGRPEPIPPGPVHIHVAAGAERSFITADLLQRVAGRAGHRPVRVTRAPGIEPVEARFDDYNIAVPEVVTSVPGGAIQIDLPEADENWITLVGNAGCDFLCVRLATLRTRHTAPPDLGDDLLWRSQLDLERWRRLVAGWATAPGRPINRVYSAEAEAALFDDLDSPTALAVLERLADDPDVAPGAKLETIIHLDLLLGLNLVADIGRS
ncbi:hypothetical protein [Spirillospora sp. CA-294931]|uniref:hypothetical protein n=1 Tax=Spirillospora sp. CA-294931 TaxID=3240042 RepID=UPI003D8CD46F